MFQKGWTAVILQKSMFPSPSFRSFFHKALYDHLGFRSRSDMKSFCFLLWSHHSGNPKELCTRSSEEYLVCPCNIIPWHWRLPVGWHGANKFTKVFVTSKLLSVTLVQCMWKMHGRCQECCIVFNYYIKHLLLPFMDQIAFYSWDIWFYYLLGREPNKCSYWFAH